MSLNKSKGNMYPWVTHTWNPISGCEHDCSYCYLRSMPNFDLKPKFRNEEMKVNLGIGKIIFVGSSGDMFGEWVDDIWIERILHYCGNFNNQYLFQTKNPGRFIDFIKMFPRVSILGTTIETNKFWITNKLSKAPNPSQRKRMIEIISRDYGKDTMISIEPILDMDVELILHWLREIKPKFISVGADSKGHNLTEPRIEHVRYLLKDARRITEVKVKENLYRILEKRSQRRKIYD